MTRALLPYSFDTDPNLLEDAIGALRISGQIVQKLAEPPGCYSVNGGEPSSSAAVIALAWDTGLMGEDGA